MLYLTLGFILFLSSVLLVKAYRPYAHLMGLIDMPNLRSSHQLPTVKGGGLVFVLVWLLAVCLAMVAEMGTTGLFFLLPGAVLLAALGFADDWQGLSNRSRLFIQLAAAIVTIYSLDGMTVAYLTPDFAIYNPYLFWPLAVLFIVWSVNLFNFMDGTDGLAAVEAEFFFFIAGLILWLEGEAWLAYNLWGLCLCLGGFLVWNWPKAKIFMGSVGSYFLGFLVAAVAIMANCVYALPMSIWLILYAAFWFDASLTLLRRMLRGHRWTQGHRLHAYQRLQEAGWDHQQILIGLIVVNTVLAALAMWAYHSQVYTIANILALSWVALVYWRVECLAPMKDES